MTGWRMRPSGVEAVAANVAEPYRTLQDGIGDIPDATETARGGAHSSLVSDALDAFIGVTAPLLIAARDRVPSAVDGLRGTTDAIAAGDDEMATTMDAQAVTGFTGMLPRPEFRQAK